MLIGSGIMIISMFTASISTSWWMFVVFYAVFYPMGIGITYWVPIICGWEWFPDNKGAVTGAIVAGFGFGAFAFGFLTTAIANPNNIRPHNKESFGDNYFPDEVSKNVPHMI